MFGGWASDRTDRRNATLASGVALAVVAACMAFAAGDPAFYFRRLGWPYAGFTGVAYATYYPFVVRHRHRRGNQHRYSICTSA